RDDSRFGGEVLYYGGRVYSDLGDYPTALAYFREGIEATPSESNLHLRGNLLSQTARLLIELKTYKEAVPYLVESITIDSIGCDTFNLAYDYQLMCDVYLQRNMLDSAYHNISMSIEVGKNLPPEDKANMQSYLARVEYLKGNQDQSLTLINGVVDKIEPEFQSAALLFATDIYLKSNQLDSAYYFAERLLKNGTNRNVIYGYNRILSTDLINYVPKDSIGLYYNRFYKEVLANYRLHDDETAYLQNTLYNYQRHDKLRRETEQKQKYTVIILHVLLLVTICFVLVSIFSRIKSKNKIIQLQSLLEKVKMRENDTTESNLEIDVTKHINEEDLRSQLRAELIRKNEEIPNVPVSSAIKNSIVYKSIIEYISHKTAISDNNDIWDKLSNMIARTNPGFKKTLSLLSVSNLSQSEYHTLMLIKCGISPTDMCILLSRTKGTISKRREILCNKIMGEKLGTQNFDNIIRLL
ncbi:MAG: hypothetical protein K2F99_03005, partial [Muribaculaceae bacterium]|nr:hypothetical protein [Muribaculaceae bacterium]